MTKEEKDLTHCERICEILCETAVTELYRIKLIQPKVVKEVQVVYDDEEERAVDKKLKDLDQQIAKMKANPIVVPKIQIPKTIQIPKDFHIPKTLHLPLTERKLIPKIHLQKSQRYSISDRYSIYNSREIDGYFVMGGWSTAGFTLIVSGCAMLYHMYANANPDHRKHDCYVTDQRCEKTGSDNVTERWLWLFQVGFLV